MYGMPIFCKPFYNMPESFNNGQKDNDDELDC